MPHRATLLGVVSLGLALCAPAAALGAPEQPRGRWVITIAANGDAGGGGRHALRKAEAGADAVEAALRARGFLPLARLRGLTKAEETIPCPGRAVSPRAEPAHRGRIEALLRGLDPNEPVSSPSPFLCGQRPAKGDQLVVFIALHGQGLACEDDITDCSVVFDAAGRPLKIAALTAGLGQSMTYDVLLLLDACQGGFALGERVLRGAVGQTRRVVSRKVIASSAHFGPGGKATEPLDGRWSPFVEAIVDGAAGWAELDYDGHIRFNELAAYIERTVTGQTGHQQPLAGGFYAEHPGDPLLWALEPVPLDVADVELPSPLDARRAMGRLIHEAVPDGSATVMPARLRALQRYASGYLDDRLQRLRALGTRLRTPTVARRPAARRAVADEMKQLRVELGDTPIEVALVDTVAARMAEEAGAPDAAEAAREAEVQLGEAVQQVLVESQRSPPIRRTLDAAGVEAETVDAVVAQLAAPVALPMTRLRPEMRPIPAGTFWMGSPKAEQAAAAASRGKNYFADEHRHEVTLARGYWLAKTEVTRRQWRAVMGGDPSYFGGDDERPVERVSWFAALAYCNRLSAREDLRACYRLAGCTGDPNDGGEGKRTEDGYACTSAERVEGCDGYRLPTEAEWEFAARAGTETATYAGPIGYRGRHLAPVLDRIAWYWGNSEVDDKGYGCSGWPEMQHPAQRRCGTHTVGRKTANGFGLHDMLGNVWEWTFDAFEADISANVDGAPIDAPIPRSRVFRGCGLVSFTAFCRAAYRDSVHPALRFADQGFRVARTRRSGPEPSGP